MSTISPVSAGTPLCSLELTASPSPGGPAGDRVTIAEQQEARRASPDRLAVVEPAAHASEHQSTGNAHHTAHSALLMPTVLRDRTHIQPGSAVPSAETKARAKNLSPEEGKLLRERITKILDERRERSNPGAAEEDTSDYSADIPPLWADDAVVTPNGTNLMPEIADHIWITANTKPDFTHEDIARTLPNLQVKQVKDFLNTEHARYKEKALELSSEGHAPAFIASQMPGVPLPTIRGYLMKQGGQNAQKN